MKKTLFRDALGGIVIGLLLSVIFSYFLHLSIIRSTLIQQLVFGWNSIIFTAP